MKNIIEKFRLDSEKNRQVKIQNTEQFECKLSDEHFKEYMASVTKREKRKVSKGKAGYFLEPYIPPSTKPLTFVFINIHIFQNSHGGNNFQSCDMPRILQILDWVNCVYAFNHTPSDTAICSAHTIPPQGIDSRIRFVINRVEFYKSDSLNASVSDSDFVNAMIARDENMKKQLNIFLLGANTTPHAFLPSPDMNYNSYVFMSSTYNTPGGDYAASLTWVHELGHILGLLHTYPQWPGGPEFDENNDFYMFDIFGCGADAIIPHVGGWSIEPYEADRDGKTNNIMGSSYKAGWISTLQIAQMSYCLQNYNIQKYTMCCDKFNKSAFGAKIDRLVSAGDETLLEYTTTLENFSWAFDGKYFTVPCDGVYLISVSFQKDSLANEGTPNDVWIHLMNSECQVLGTAYSEKSDKKTNWSPGEQQFGRRDQVGFTQIYDLKKGTMLYTVVKSEDNALRNICEVNFCVTLLINKCNF